jgi:hypothetical protein
MRRQIAFTQTYQQLPQALEGRTFGEISAPLHGIYPKWRL